MILSGYIKTLSSKFYFIMLEIYENIFSLEIVTFVQVLYKCKVLYIPTGNIAV